jgi:hypothetical protein
LLVTVMAEAEVVEAVQAEDVKAAVKEAVVSVISLERREKTEAEIAKEVEVEAESAEDVFKIK